MTSKCLKDRLYKHAKQGGADSAYNGVGYMKWRASMDKTYKCLEAIALYNGDEARNTQEKITSPANGKQNTKRGANGARTDKGEDKQQPQKQDQQENNTHQ